MCRFCFFDCKIEIERLRGNRNLACPAGAQEGENQVSLTSFFLKEHGEIFRTETTKERQRIFFFFLTHNVRPFLYL